MAVRKSEEEKRYQTFCEMIEALDEGVALIGEYDSLPHDYGGEIMFQAEMQMVKAIGDAPGITASQIAKRFRKTASACSQLIRKLRGKRWIVQERNAENNREYRLMLTEAGRDIYRKHQAFEQACYGRTYAMLESIGDEEMKGYIRIQRLLNRAFALDVAESRSPWPPAGAVCNKKTNPIEAEKEEMQ